MSVAKRSRPAVARDSADDGVPSAAPRRAAPRKAAGQGAAADAPARTDDSDPVRAGEVVLTSGTWRLGVLPGLGGCWSFGQVRADGTWVDLLRPTPDDALGDPERTASFPLVPWSNRIRDGLLEWHGEHFQLVRNGPDGTAIHGAVRQLPWQVDSRSASALELRFTSCDVVGVNWPWRFSARQLVSLEGDALAVTLSITNDDDVPFPAGLGHHPYFRRRLREEEAVLLVDAVAGYALDQGMAVRSAGSVPKRANYRKARPLGPDFVDDVLTGLGPVPARWWYPDAGIEVQLRTDPAFSHLVVYLPEDSDHFAVEPVTHVNDGMTLCSRGVSGTGVRTLAPGETFTGTLTFTVSPHSS